MSCLCFNLKNTEGESEFRPQMRPRRTPHQDTKYPCSHRGTRLNYIQSGNYKYCKKIKLLKYSEKYPQNIYVIYIDFYKKTFYTVYSRYCVIYIFLK